MTIDKRLFREVENYLHQRRIIVKIRVQALNNFKEKQKLLIAKSSLPDRLDNLYMQTLTDDLERAKAIKQCIDKTHEYFKDRDEGILFKKYYGKKISQNFLALILHVDKRQVAKWRSTVVIHLLLLLSNKQIIKF